MIYFVALGGFLAMCYGVEKFFANYTIIKKEETKE